MIKNSFDDFSEITDKNVFFQEGEDNGGLSKFTVLPCGGLGVDSDTYWNQLYTATAARSMLLQLPGRTSSILQQLPGRTRSIL